ncbi:MAG: DUF7487 domain-containing protein [Nitrosopumilaceae archaeon]
MYSKEIKIKALNYSSYKDLKELRVLTGLSLRRQILLDCILNDIIPSKCKTCGNIVTAWNEIKNMFGEYCSCLCKGKDPQLKEKIKQTMLGRYGVNNPSKSKEIQKKKKQTNLKKYGTEYPTQNKEIQKKKKQTNLKKYGVECPFQMTEFKEKRKQTCIGKYDAEHPLQNKKIKEKMKQTNLRKYGVEHHAQKHFSEYCLEKLNDPEWLKEQHHELKKPLTQIAFELRISYSCLGTYFKYYNIQVKPCKESYKAILWLEFIQKQQNMFVQHAQNLGEYTIPNTRIKVDGYCKETNTIYEFYGDLYHGNPIIFEPNYKMFIYKTAGELYQKTIERENKIKELGYNLVIIWENEWDKIAESIEQLKEYYSKLADEARKQNKEVSIVDLSE